MKTTIILLGILFGYFIPKDTFFIIFFLIVIMFLFGFVFPDMMNANSLRNKVDREKVTFKNKITIYKMNTISFWIGVFVFVLDFNHQEFNPSLAVWITMYRFK